MKKIKLDQELPTISPNEISESHDNAVLKCTKINDLVTISRLSNHLKVQPQSIEYVMKKLVSKGKFENLGYKHVPNVEGRGQKQRVYRRIN